DRGHDDLVPGVRIERRHREMKRAGAGGRGHSLIHPEPGGESLLECLDLRFGRDRAVELSGVDNLGEQADLLVTEVATGGVAYRRQRRVADLRPPVNREGVGGCRWGHGWAPY